MRYLLFIGRRIIEHVAQPAQLISEMHRILKPGGTGVVTLPWSARFHYRPHDYHRYTPTMLTNLFARFASVNVLARGSDICAIANKSLVLYLGNLTQLRSSLLWFPFRLLFLLLLWPIIGLLLLWAQLALAFRWGSEDDPLGYTIELKK